MLRVILRRWLYIATAVLAAAPVAAGTVSITWDAASGATGYRIYYGGTSRQYTNSLSVGNVTEATIDNLTDCTPWYLAVKAYNTAGESADFSNEVTGWPRPAVTAVSPNIQGTKFTMTIDGANFETGVSVVPDPDDTTIRLASARAISCNEIQVAASIDPPTRGVRAAQVGTHALTVQNPDGVYIDTLAFQVGLNPARFDVNQNDHTTLGRIDGQDVAWISRLNAVRESDADYDPDADINGDGWIDGEDFSFVAANFGLCWSGTAWTLAACPADLK